MTTLELLKQQAEALEAQIRPLEKACHEIREQIRAIERDELLAKYGLKMGDALAFTRECMDKHTWMTEGEKVSAPATVYISDVDDRRGYVVLSAYPDGGGMAYCAVYELAQRMKAAYQAQVSK